MIVWLAYFFSTPCQQKEWSINNTETPWQVIVVLNMDIIRFYLPVDSLVKSMYFKTKGMLQLVNIHTERIAHICVYICTYSAYRCVYIHKDRESFKVDILEEYSRSRLLINNILYICKTVGMPTELEWTLSMNQMLLHLPISQVQQYTKILTHTCIRYQGKIIDFAKKQRHTTFSPFFNISSFKKFFFTFEILILKNLSENEYRWINSKTIQGWLGQILKY